MSLVFLCSEKADESSLLRGTEEGKERPDVQNKIN